MTHRCWMQPIFAPLPGQFTVVLPACARDIDLLLANLDWQEELDGRKTWDCVLALDSELPDEKIVDAEQLAWRTFSEVETYLYPTAPVKSWPQAPNWAFQHTALYMQERKRSWFWMEPDCVPLCQDWCYRLNQEYSVKRKPIMGAIVKGMGHCNGTAIYPANFPRLSRQAMQCTDRAWDGEMKDETIKLTHNAGQLMCHVWGIINGIARPTGGEPAHFSSWRDVERWVCPNAAVFHRSKDTSLIDQLRLERRKP